MYFIFYKKLQSSYSSVSSSSFGRNNYSGGSISPPTISSSFLELPSPLRRSETPTWIEPRSVERSQSPPEPKKSAGSSFFRFKSILMKRFEQYSEIKAKICFCYIWMNKTTYYLSLSNLFYLGKMIYFFYFFLGFRSLRSLSRLSSNGSTKDLDEIENTPPPPPNVQQDRPADPINIKRDHRRGQSLVLIALMKLHWLKDLLLELDKIISNISRKFYSAPKFQNILKLNPFWKLFALGKSVDCVSSI